MARRVTTPVTRRVVQHRSRSRNPGAGLCIESHGVVARVQCCDAAFLELVRRNLPPGSAPSARAVADVTYDVQLRAGSTAEGTFDVVSHHPAAPDGEYISDGATLEVAALMLSRDLEFLVALHAPADLFVHAAAVAWQGRVIALPGQSHSGKSTLTAALLKAGAEYLSDEFTVLGSTGLVHPFHRPIHIRDGTVVHKLPPESVGRMAFDPMPLGAVVQAQFGSHARWQPAPMTAGEVALTLLNNSVAARVRPAHVLGRIGEVLRGTVIGLRGTRGEAHANAPSILQSVEQAWSRVPTT